MPAIFRTGAGVRADHKRTGSPTGTVFGSKYSFYPDQDPAKISIRIHSKISIRIYIKISIRIQPKVSIRIQTTPESGFELFLNTIYFIIIKFSYQK